MRTPPKCEKPNGMAPVNESEKTITDLHSQINSIRKHKCYIKVL